MKLILGSKKKRSLLFKALILGFIVYIILLIVNQQMLIHEKLSKIESLNEQLSLQQMKNEEIQKELDASDDADIHYIEKSARNDLRLAKRGERVFVNSAGNE